MSLSKKDIESNLISKIKGRILDVLDKVEGCGFSLCLDEKDQIEYGTNILAVLNEEIKKIKNVDLFLIRYRLKEADQRQIIPCDIIRRQYILIRDASEKSKLIEKYTNKILEVEDKLKGRGTEIIVDEGDYLDRNTRDELAENMEEKYGEQYRSKYGIDGDPWGWPAILIDDKEYVEITNKENPKINQKMQVRDQFMAFS